MHRAKNLLSFGMLLLTCLIIGLAVAFAPADLSAEPTAIAADHSATPAALAPVEEVKVLPQGYLTALECTPLSADRLCSASEANDPVAVMCNEVICPCSTCDLERHDPGSRAVMKVIYSRGTIGRHIAGG